MASVVVLDLISEVAVPDYCVHGKTRCVGCDQWCHLGTNTFETVANGKALPMCKTCLRFQEQMTGTAPELLGNVEDRPRSQGPHE